MATSDSKTSTATLLWTRTAILAFCLLLAAVLATTLWAGTARAANFTVTNTNDSGDGSLREAIEDANTNDNPSEVDTIEFAIPADTDTGCEATTGVCTISPTSALPDITEAVNIDAYTQSGASPNTLATGNDAQLKVELSGAGVQVGANGIRVSTSNCVVRGLVINRWSNEGVEIKGVEDPGASGNRIEGNFIGTDPTGEVALGNVNGVRLVDDAVDNVIGGTSPAARNVISGNVRGFAILIGSNGNRVRGNFIGTDASGTQDLGNEQEGGEIRSSSDNVIGGTSAAARNIISGNDRDGVVLGGGADAGSNKVRGNFIGTDASGTRELGNAGDGVHNEGDVLDNVVGGALAGAGNVISGNDGDGIELAFATGQSVRGNHIGTDVSGQEDLGNAENGVRIVSASNNTVGGTSAASANTIAHNGGDGVLIEEFDESGTDEATGNSVLRNSIFGNGELGIDLGEGTEDSSGVTANDPDDLDTGPNLLQNYPVISSATTPDGGSVSVQGTLDSTPNASFVIRFFSRPRADPSGHGEGETHLGRTFVTTDAEGDATFSFSSGTSVAAGKVVSATATNTSTGDTSEFSGAIAVQDDTAPRVVSTRPSDGARDVPPGVDVLARFSEPMRASTINTSTFKLFQRQESNSDEPLAARVSYDADARRAELDPEGPLEPGIYVARVTQGARDISDNPLAETETFRFTVTSWRLE